MQLKAKNGRLPFQASGAQAVVMPFSVSSVPLC